LNFESDKPKNFWLSKMATFEEFLAEMATFEAIMY
jgi:hypothetical protein